MFRQADLPSFGDIAVTLIDEVDKTDTPKETVGPRHQKVIRFRILKPTGDTTWRDLASVLRNATYRVFRLANLIVSEAYLRFHLHRTGQTETYKLASPNELNRRLRDMLLEEKTSDEELARFSASGAVPDTVCGALAQYKTRAVTTASKWKDVTRGKASLPSFRLTMPIPLRCDKAEHRRLERMPNGDVELDLLICRKPYPRVVLETAKLNGGQQAILDQLLENSQQSLDGYRQRCFEVKHDERSNTWSLYITYDFPATPFTGLKSDIVVGVDLGFACPLYAAINNGHARLGWRQFATIAARIRSLQTQVMARRRQMLTGGKSSLTLDTARSGHGRKRRIRPIEQLEGRISDAYRTLNHQLSASVIGFARDHGAATIQMEDLSGLKDHLTGTFLGSRWRYHQLQQFLEYKAKEAGLAIRKVNARYTSRRCSKCGFIHAEFTREFRDRERRQGFARRFQCPKCEFEADPDYNAARNLALVDIEERVAQQCVIQQIPERSLTN